MEEKIQNTTNVEETKVVEAQKTYTQAQVDDIINKVREGAKKLANEELENYKKEISPFIEEIKEAKLFKSFKKEGFKEEYFDYLKTLSDGKDLKEFFKDPKLDVFRAKKEQIFKGESKPHQTDDKMKNLKDGEQDFINSIIRQYK